MSNVQFTSTGSAGSADIRTPEQIKAEGDVKVQTRAITWVGVIVTILSLGGILAFFYCPEKAQSLWTVIAPIILAAITGTLGFLAGEKSAKRRQ